MEPSLAPLRAPPVWGQLVICNLCISGAHVPLCVQTWMGNASLDWTYALLVPDLTIEHLQC